MSQQKKSHPHRVSDCESIDTKSENNSEKNPSNCNDSHNNATNITAEESSS